VEALWARRKVGYMLDQIRANGEKPELVSEVTALAKKYGIMTPYTSYLIVPDAAVPVATKPADGKPVIFRVPELPSAPSALNGPGGVGKPQSVEEFAKENQQKPGELGANRGAYADRELDKETKPGDDKADGGARREAKEKKLAYDAARGFLQKKDQESVQSGKLGVDLSCQTANLRNQSRLDQSAIKNVYGRNCMEFGGVWIDEGFDAKMKTVTVKAQSDAYFKLLERHPKVKDVLMLGNHLVWVTPNGTALVIDAAAGKESLSNDEIDALFVAQK
jgi:Ca-activated chloride channel family protein